MTIETVKPGDRRTWKKVVSNYGHIDGVPVVVLSVGPRRVYVETQYCDGKPERRVRVKPENLFPARPSASEGSAGLTPHD